MAIHYVGPQRLYPSLSGALAVAQTGDEIRVDPGSYDDDGATLTVPLTIRGWGGIPVIQARGLLRNGKGLLWSRTDATVEDLEFRGAFSQTANGAGIRHSHGHLVVRRCIFTGNQNGLFLDGNPASSAVVTESAFSHNGGGCGHTHGVYACSGVASLTVGLCSFHDTMVGHHVKSRAGRSWISHNSFTDSPDATTSYAIDISNGGEAMIAENTFVKGRRSLSATIIAYGGEGLIFPDNAFRVLHNVFISHRRGLCIATRNHARAVSAELEENGYEDILLRLVGRGTSRRVKPGQRAIGDGAMYTPFSLPQLAGPDH